jgi:hypothetical protein
MTELKQKYDASTVAVMRQAALFIAGNPLAGKTRR